MPPRISIVVMEESFLRTHRGTKTWFTRSEGTQKSTTHVTAHEGPSQLRFITASKGNEREKNSSSMSGTSSHSSGAVRGCSGRAGWCRRACHQLSKTGQDRPNPAHLTDMMMWNLLQGRSSWRRSAIESVSISRSSLIMSGSLGWKFWCLWWPAEYDATQETSELDVIVKTFLKITPRVIKFCLCTALFMLHPLTWHTHTRAATWRHSWSRV